MQNLRNVGSLVNGVWVSGALYLGFRFITGVCNKAVSAKPPSGSLLSSRKQKAYVTYIIRLNSMCGAVGIWLYKPHAQEETHYRLATASGMWLLLFFAPVGPAG